jgi:oxygen-dependent protoporphyrinogen oxidase
MSKVVHIIGAGFSSLTLAWELRRRGMDVHIYEQSERTGGLLRSTRTLTHLREAAANGIMWNSRLQNLSEELDLSFYPASEEAKKRFIYRRGLRRWPLSGKETLDFLWKTARFFFHTKIRRDQSMKPQPHETIAHWCVRNATPATHEYLIKPVLQGIHAGDTEGMSASLVVKAVGGSKGTYAPRNGMEALIQSLERHLLKKGVRFSMGQKMGGSELPPPNEPLVVATSAWTAAEILRERFPQVSAQLQKIHSVPLVSVTNVWKMPVEQLPGFGCLFPPIENFHSLGVLANGNIFPDRGPDYSETWILGGALKQNICQLSDEELQSLVLEDRQRMLGSLQNPSEVFIERYERALPRYDLQLEEVLENLKLPDHLFLTGNYLGRLGLAKIYDQNIALAEAMAKVYV